MTSPKPLRAYEVQEIYEGHSEIVFARYNLEARRLGAHAVNEGEIEGLRVRRIPGADRYAPGPVPVEFLVENLGWWYECSNCYQAVRVDEFPDRCYDRHGVYCNKWCRLNYYEKKGKDKAQENLALWEADRFLPLGIPRDSFRPYITHTNDTQEKRGRRVAGVEFKFPGGKYPAHWIVGDETVSVAQIDLDAYLSFKEASRGNVSNS